MSDPGERTVGSMIREAREAKRLTRKEVAEALNMNQQHVYQVESGRRQPTLETLWTLANYLEIDPNTLDPRLAPKR